MLDVSRRLGGLLVDRRLLTKDSLESALSREQETGRPLPKILIEEGLVREEDLLRAVAEQVGMEFIDLDNILFDPAALEAVPVDKVLELGAIPVRYEGGVLVVAVADPFDGALKAKLEEATGGRVELGLSSQDMLYRAAQFLFGKDVDSGPEQEEVGSPKHFHVNHMLTDLVSQGGSDLHLTVGTRPQIRLNGTLRSLEGYPVMTPAQLRELVYAFLTESQRNRLEEKRGLDTSHPVAEAGRFRVNVFFQRDAIGAVFRAIPDNVQSIEGLGLPPVLKEFATFARGLVLVTGPTGHGKSTTLAALIDIINQERAEHILTIEDPIEFVHNHKRSVVNQREVGSDTESFGDALRHALRQDPDVILVGEMRDLETISTALTAAETGHLVFATLHTRDAAQTVDRIIDVFPAHQQQQIRVQLASSLQAIASQQLLVTSDSRGRLAAVEVLVATPGIRALIRDGKTHQIASSLQAGGRYGMQTMDQALAELVRRGQVSFETALDRCANVEDFQRIIGRVA
ncbi:MAG: PilT/PilU family type 4a pilus ATPase [Acidimicrobiia bacterium]